MGISFLSLICACMVCLKEKYAKKIKSKKIKMFYIWLQACILGCGSYRMYLEGDSPYQTVMIVCELKWFSHIPNCHNMLTHLQSCDVFHRQHSKFFAILDTCAGTMWFGHHKVYKCWCMLTKLSWLGFWNIKLVRLVLCVCVCFWDPYA